MSSQALTTSYLQSNLTNISSTFRFPSATPPRKKQLFPGGQGPDSFLSYMHTKHMLHFLRSVHHKIDILCIVKTLGSAYHEARLLRITNLLPHLNSSGCNRLFQPLSPQALLLRFSQHITLQILHQFQHFSSLVIPFPISTKIWIIQCAL